MLVKVDARPIQPSDFMFIAGRYRIKPALPQVAGMEGMGTVVAAGAEAHVAPGTRVAFRHPGTWAEFLSVPEECVYAVPAGISAERAAQFALNPVTAWALLDQLTVKPGHWIAINAATSSIAQIVYGLAKRRHIGMIGVVARDRDITLPFPTVNANGSNVPDSVLRITGGELLAGMLDSLGGRAIADFLPLLRQGATIVSFAVLMNVWVANS